MNKKMEAQLAKQKAPAPRVAVAEKPREEVTTTKLVDPTPPPKLTVTATSPQSTAGPFPMSALGLLIPIVATIFLKGREEDSESATGSVAVSDSTVSTQAPSMGTRVEESASQQQSTTSTSTAASTSTTGAVNPAVAKPVTKPVVTLSAQAQADQKQAEDRRKAIIATQLERAKEEELKAKEIQKQWDEKLKQMEADAGAKAIAKAEGEAKAKAEAEAKAKAEAAAKAKAEAEVKAKAEAEVKAKAEAEAKAKAEAEAKAKAENEAKAKAESEAKAKAESEAKAKAEAEAKAKAESEAKAKAEAEAKAKSEAEAKAKSEAEAKAKSEAEAKAKAESEAKAKAESEAKAKAESEAKAKAEAEAKAKAESESKAKAETEAKAKAEAEAKAKVEAEAKAKVEAEALAKSAERHDVSESILQTADDVAATVTDKEDFTTIISEDVPMLTEESFQKELNKLGQSIVILPRQTLYSYIVKEAPEEEELSAEMLYGNSLTELVQIVLEFTSIQFDDVGDDLESTSRWLHKLNSELGPHIESSKKWAQIAFRSAEDMSLLK
jgi:hypothetical protein